MKVKRSIRRIYWAEFFTFNSTGIHDKIIGRVISNGCEC